MPITRKTFIKRSLQSALMIGMGNAFQSFVFPFELPDPADVQLRFAMASDGHYGQPDTEYEFRHDTMIDWLNEEYQARGIDFTMINGDLFHNRVEYLQLVKDKWDLLEMPYYVSHGNHDLIDSKTWEQTWKMPFDYSFEKEDVGFMVLNTASDSGTFICPDIAWTTEQLKRFESKKHLFVFMHITPFKWTSGGIACPEITSMFSRQKNLRAIFHGHDHDQDNVKTSDGKLYFFDSHIAGNWGTDYYGYRIVEILKDGNVLTYQMNAARKHTVNRNKLV
jgi:3',5'-cyclic-AMP phosphodiesterase